MEEYPKRLYLDDGTTLTVNTAAEEALWRNPPPPEPDATEVVDESTLKKAVKNAFGKGATDA